MASPSFRPAIYGSTVNRYLDRRNARGHLGVRRPWRRMGIGTALLRHSLVEFYRRGIFRVRLRVDFQSLTNETGLYERAGMLTIQQYHIYSKELDLGSA